MNKGSAIRVAMVLFIAVLVSLAASAATISPRTRVARSKSASVVESPRAARKIKGLKHSRPVKRVPVRKAKGAPPKKAKLVLASVRTRTARRKVRNRYVERFHMSSFADDVTEGDITTGEDPMVRAAAIEALGGMNGTLVAIDPASGRILTMVNQKLALSAGATPCSTIKVPVALAALSDNLITKETRVPLGKRWTMNLTQALAVSNNAYFEVLGRRLGFEKYSYYAHQYGLGELAGWNIRGEQLGRFPTKPLETKLGGVGKMCSFGESISMTPLQLGALMSAMANGGTLYYLQHPTSAHEIVNFQPKVKRHLDIAPLVPELQPGMAGAVSYGTARSLRVNFSEEQILGKTGTCSNNAGTRYGWFTSYANTEYGRIVTVIFLQGGRPTFGPKAAELAGRFYRNLYDHSFFASRPISPTQSAVTRSSGAAQ